MPGFRFTLLLFGFAAVAFSQQDARFDQRVANAAQTIQHLEHLAFWQVALTIAVAAIGSAVSVIQGIERGWSKLTTVALGALITVLTAVTANLFPADFRAINKSIVTMRKIHLVLEDLRDDIKKATDPVDKTGAIAKFGQKYTEFITTEEKLLGQTASVNLVGAAYAAEESQPAWVRNPPPELKGTLFFSGVGKGASYTQAQDAAIRNAGEAAASRVSGQKKGLSPALATAVADFVVKTAAVADTYYVRDPTTREYVFHALLRVSADIKDLDFASLLPQTALEPMLKFNSLLVNEDGGHGPTLWTFDIFVNKIKKATLVSRSYDNKGEPNPILVWPSVALPKDGVVNIEIRGFRPDKPSVTVTGMATLAPNSTQVIKTRNFIPLRGSFDFSLSAIK